MKTLIVVLALTFSSMGYGDESEVGRYQIMHSADETKTLHSARGAITFLLDTSTGRTWGWTTFGFLKGNPKAWKELDRIDDSDAINEGEDSFISMHQENN